MNWLYISLKLTSIVLSACFAALALLTKFKDENGRITRPGKIALGGIVGTAVLSTILYALDVRYSLEAAQQAKLDAEAAAQRLLTPLGPMRLRLRIKVPAAQFAAFRDRIVSEKHGWQQPYPMPIPSRDGPRNLPTEIGARNFFGLIMIAISADNMANSQQRRPPGFGKLVLISLAPPESDQYVEPQNVESKGDNRAAAHLFYDFGKDLFILDSETSYFDDFDSSNQFLSFHDFENSVVRLAFNVRERIHYEVEFVEFQSRNGKRTIWIEGFRNTPNESDTFSAVIPPAKALLD